MGVIANDQQDVVEFLDQDGNVEEYEFSSGGQTAFSQLEVIQSVLSRYSDAQGDKFADLIQTDQGGFLYVSGPIYDSRGRFAGG